MFLDFWGNAFKCDANFVSERMFPRVDKAKGENIEEHRILSLNNSLNLHHVRINAHKHTTTIQKYDG